MTIKEIAELSGVSTATVSYVLNNNKAVSPKTRERVMAVVEEAGYKPNRIAKSLRMKSTNAIGVLVEDIRGFSVPTIINGISEYVEQEGYHILLNDLRILEEILNQYDLIYGQKDKINDAIELLLSGARVDAIIFVGMFDRDITGIIEDIHKPLVVAYSTINSRQHTYVTYDNENVSREVVEYLMRFGHKRIAVISGLPDTYPVCMRLQGARRALEAAGLSLEKPYVMEGDWEYESGFSCMRQLLALPEPPTAVFAMNDLMAAGAMDAISAAGLSVPGDISIVGFDNREISAYLKPALTTVQINLKDVGRSAAQAAIERIRGQGAMGGGRVIPSDIVLRNTVKKCLEKK